MLDPLTLRVVVFNLLLLGSCGYAIWRGGPPERITGCLLMAAALLTIVTQSRYARFHHVEMGVFVVDLLLLGALVAVALSADRFWPVILSALQLDATAAHILKLFDADLIRITYALMLAVWSYPMLLILAIATARHRARLKRFGEDRAWSVRTA